MFNIRKFLYNYFGINAGGGKNDAYDGYRVFLKEAFTLFAKQQDIPSEYVEIVNNNFWNLI